MFSNLISLGYHAGSIGINLIKVIGDTAASYVYLATSFDSNDSESREKNLAKAKDYANKAGADLLEAGKNFGYAVKDIAYIGWDTGKFIFTAATVGYAYLPEKGQIAETVGNIYDKCFSNDNTIEGSFTESFVINEACNNLAYITAISEGTLTSIQDLPLMGDNLFSDAV